MPERPLDAASAPARHKTVASAVKYLFQSWFGSRSIRIAGAAMADRFSGSVLRSDAGDDQLLPSLGEIGLNNFAPYLMNRIMARWNTNIAEELKALDITTTQMRALAVLSVSTQVTINELSVFAVTEQSTMSRTLDS